VRNLSINLQFVKMVERLQDLSDHIASTLLRGGSVYSYSFSTHLSHVPRMWVLTTHDDTSRPLLIHVLDFKVDSMLEKLNVVRLEGVGQLTNSSTH
jgi:hypothetical protein